MSYLISIGLVLLSGLFSGLTIGLTGLNKFELERKNAIEATINKVENKGHRKNLRQLQKKWDNILKNSGSRHNRFVLIQMLFWDQVNNNYRPTLNCFR